MLLLFYIIYRKVCLGIGGNDIKPSMSVEHALADIKDTFQTPVLAKIPFTEIVL